MFNYNLRPVDFVGQYMKGKTFAQENEKSEAAERERAMLKDARMLQYYLDNNLNDDAMALAQGRYEALINGGADPSDTGQIYTKLVSGDYEGAKHDVKAFLNAYQQLTNKESKGYSFDAKTGLVLNKDTGEVTVNETAKKQLEYLESLDSEGGKIDLKDLKGLNDKVTDFTKQAVDIKTSANDLVALSENPTGPATIAAVFKFMKALDPQSVVREGEFYQAQSSAGVPEMLTNMANKIFSGQLLTPEQFVNFIDASKRLANNAVTSARNEATTYLDVFGDRIPTKERNLLNKRLPILFDIKKLPLTPKELQGLTSKPEGKSEEEIMLELNLPDVGGGL